MKQIQVVLAPAMDGVRLLVRSQGRDRVRALLGPHVEAHPRAAATLLEGLSLWEGERLGVVVCADERCDGRALGLYQALAHHELHFDVGIAYHPAPRRRAVGLGSFHDLRRFKVMGVAS